MRFGTNVILTRKSVGLEVKAILIGARGNQVKLRLMEDNPNAGLGREPAGTVGWWGKSAIRRDDVKDVNVRLVENLVNADNVCLYGEGVKVHKCPHLKTCPGFGKVQCEDKTCPKGGPNAAR